MDILGQGTGPTPVAVKVGVSLIPRSAFLPPHGKKVGLGGTIGFFRIYLDLSL